MVKLLFTILFSFSLHAQSTNDRTIYLDSLCKETSQKDHIYYRVIKDFYNTRDLYEINDYYKSSVLFMSGILSEKSMQTREGAFTFYYENGNKKKLVHYVKSIESGDYFEWYPNGQKKVEARYEKNESADLPSSEIRILNYWTPENQQMVIDGNGYYEERNFEYSTFSEGKIVNGVKDGIWSGNNKGSKSTFTETYENGKLLTGISTDSSGKKYEYTEVFEKPEPKKGIKDFYAHIAKNLSIPKKAGDVNGKMVLSFVINKEGNAVDFEILQSLGKIMDNEGIRVIKKYPDWNIGKARGIPARVQYSIPIKVISAE